MGNKMSFEIIKNMPYTAYAERDGINNSLLKAVKEESLATVHGIIKKEIVFENDTLDFGTAFHDLTLEGKKNYVIRPDEYAFGKKWTMNATFCKEWVAKQGDRTVLSTSEAAKLEGMAKAVQEHPEMAPLLRGKTELSVFAEKKGIKLKARIDLLPDDPAAPVIDFKKTRSAKPEEFVKQLWNLRYYMQAAMYLDVLRMADIDRKEFWFVAVEDFSPFNIYICKLRDHQIGFLEFGRHEYRDAYQTLMKAINTNCWPTWPSSSAEEHMTAWMQNAIEAATA